jgi:site-specific DNA-methyltransferase (adenine-specific)
VIEPYFQSDGVSIYLGDCREILPRLGPLAVSCVIGDPPYGETSLQWDAWPVGWLDAVADAVPINASLWCFGSLRMFMREASQFNRWRMSHDVVWEKQNGTGFLNDRFRKVHELAGHFYRDAAPWADVYKSPRFTLDATKRTVRKKAKPAQWQGAVGPSTYTSIDGGPRLMRSVLQFRNEHGRAIHPTQKPLSLLGPLLEYACPPTVGTRRRFARVGGDQPPRTSPGRRLKPTKAIRERAAGEFESVAYCR